MTNKFLTAEWRKLAIANYIIDPDILLPFLPYKTELDLWNGHCYVSLVGFRFINTRLKGISIPFHRNFEEVNLRFYLKYKHGNEWKRGVTFIKEIVPKHALTFIANNVYGEKYQTMPTKHLWIETDNSLKISYAWKHDNSWDNLQVTCEKQATEIQENTDEEFITEHYWGYTKLNSLKTSEYQVEHPRWKCYPVKDYDINVRFRRLYGEAFSGLDQMKPDSVMLAEGSLIAVRSANILS